MAGTLQPPARRRGGGSRLGRGHGGLRVGASRRLIVVSNRGPVSFQRDADGRRIPNRGSGGLASALRSLARRHEVTWIASALGDEDRRVAAEGGGEAVEERLPDGSSYRLRLVDHDPPAFEAFYNVVSNPALWFVQHYLYDLSSTPAWGPDFAAAWRDGYARVNAAFAEAVLTELESDPEAAVFFQDYHLYLAPRLVREARSEATLAHFVHIPWPHADQWHVLPAPLRAAVHDGLLANDLVGLHAERWRENFFQSCAAVLGAQRDGGSILYCDRRTSVVARPISVDPDEVEELAASGEVDERRQELQATRPEKLVVRVDRTDPSKNIVRGFQAFALYLERHPEMHGRVRMLALLDPSRQSIREYAEYLTSVEETVKALNRRFGRSDWLPVDLRIEDDVWGSLAAYAEFDALLVNAVFDGLNLVAKEAPLVNERDGVLVLSENAGVHAELAPWVISVNPFDVDSQADAIHAALELPAEERAARSRAIREHVRAHDLTEWVTLLLAELDEVAVPTPD
ncbi:MAG: trehalose-6-phosphate synthase [Candidatus Rokuibacteriota bacterium]|nr:MAG: trehalose-6-phosphate synthase [Candidatus Rokubacteria bacterium]